jgi:hypothetical protein
MKNVFLIFIFFSWPGRARATEPADANDDDHAFLTQWGLRTPYATEIACPKRKLYLEAVFQAFGKTE